jgi:hypothetical protein
MEKDKVKKTEKVDTINSTLIDILATGTVMFGIGLGIYRLHGLKTEDFKDNKIAEKKIADILAKNSNSKSSCISELSSEIRTERLGRKLAEKRIKELELTILNLKNELKNI